MLMRNLKDIYSLKNKQIVVWDKVFLVSYVKYSQKRIKNWFEGRLGLITSRWIKVEMSVGNLVVIE